MSKQDRVLVHKGFDFFFGLLQRFSNTLQSIGIDSGDTFYRSLLSKVVGDCIDRLNESVVDDLEGLVHHRDLYHLLPRVSKHHFAVQRQDPVELGLWYRWPQVSLREECALLV